MSDNSFCEDCGVQRFEQPGGHDCLTYLRQESRELRLKIEEKDQKIEERDQRIRSLTDDLDHAERELLELCILKEDREIRFSNWTKGLALATQNSDFWEYVRPAFTSNPELDNLIENNNVKDRIPQEFHSLIFTVTGGPDYRTLLQELKDVNKERMRVTFNIYKICDFEDSKNDVEYFFCAIPRLGNRTVDPKFRIPSPGIIMVRGVTSKSKLR